MSFYTCDLHDFVEKFFIRLGTQYEKNDINYLRQIGYDTKLEMIRWGTYNEIQDVRYTRYYELAKIYDYYYFNSRFRKKSVVLRKMFKKRRRREIAKNKYLECLSILPRQLPHEIDNIIISYCI